MSLTSFVYDIFISYAHIDDLNPFGGEKGWIDLLDERLSVLLAQALGYKVKIWRDGHELHGNDELQGAIGDAVTRSLLLVAVVSPRYVQSDWCCREMDAFHATEPMAGAGPGFRSRVFKVVKTPLLEHLKKLEPVQIRNLIGYQFYAEEESTGLTSEFSPDPTDKQYGKMLHRLVADITRALINLKHVPANSQPNDGKIATLNINPLSPAGSEKTDYLAETASDLLKERELVRDTASCTVGGTPIRARNHFKRRLPQQVELGKYLAEPFTRVVSVTGRAGIGKTALASKVLNDLEVGRWPHTEDYIPVDGIVYMSTRSVKGISLAQLLLDCGEMLGGEDTKTLEDISNSGRKPEAKVELLLKKLGKGRYFVLLDHLEELLEKGDFRDAELKAFFESSLNASNGLRLIVTSRDPLKFPPDFIGYDLEVPLLEGLPVPDGIALLRQLDPTGKSRLRDADEKQLARAVERVHGVPRALEVLAGIMKQTQLTTLDKILEKFYEQPDVVKVLIKEGYNMLDLPARNVMKALAVFGCPVPPSAVAYVLKPFTPEIDTTAVLERLLTIYMAQASHDGETVRLDPIDEEYAYYELPEQGDFSRVTLNRLAAEYCKGCRMRRESWRTIEDVGPHLREFEHRVRAGDYEEAARTLSEVDVDFLIWNGHAQRALDMRAKLEGKLTESRLQMLHANALGNIRVVLGPFSDAIDHFEAAIRIAHDIGDKEMECDFKGSLGDTYRRLGQLDKAIETHQQCQAIALELNNVKLESAHLLSFGLACVYHGDIKSGIKHANRLMEVSASSHDLLFEAKAYDCFSLAYLVVGRMDETIGYSDKALAIYQKVNDRTGSTYVLNVRGMAYIGLDRLSEAIETLDFARKISNEGSYPLLEGFCLFNLACAYRRRGEMDKAFKAASDASPLLADLHAAEGAAATALVASIRAANEGRRLDEALALLDCARASMRAPDIYDSDYSAEEARKIAQSEGRPDIIVEATRIIEEKKGKLILPD